MFKIIRFLTFYLFCFFWIEVFPSENELECKIIREVENNILAKKKNYKSTLLKIYFNKKEKWINDISKKNWLQSESYKKSNIVFTENDTFYFFKMFEFENNEKLKVELLSEISFNKSNNYLKYSKKYYNYSGEIYFETIVEGVCH